MLDKRYNYCFIDFETTGLSSERDDIIQIGFILCNSRLQIIHHFSHYINPGYDIESLKTIVAYTTGITPEQILNGMPLQESIALCMEALGASELPIVFIGQNISFDLAFLRKYLIRFDYHKTQEFLSEEGLSSLSRSIDTLEWAKVLIHYAPSYSLDVLYGILKDKLGVTYFAQIAKQLGMEELSNHDALSDCAMCIGLMQYCFAKIDGICQSYPIAKTIIQKGSLPFTDTNHIQSLSHSEVSNSKVPLLDFPEKPIASRMSDNSIDRRSIPNASKLYYGNMPIEQLVRKLSGLDKIIIASNSKQKLTILKNHCKVMGMHDMSFVKEQQQVDKTKLNAIYGKEQLSQEEVWFFLKYCSHKLQGLGLLDLNNSFDYKIYNYIRDDVLSEKSSVLLATHSALFSIIENEEYKDYTICFLDYEWWYSSFLKYRCSPWDPVNMPRVVDNYCYEYLHDNKQDGLTKLTDLVKQLDFFVQYLFHETTQFCHNHKPLKNGRYELGVISGNTNFPKTNGMYESIFHDFQNLDSIEGEDALVIQKQLGKMQLMMENLSFATVSGYGHEQYTYTLANNFVEYSEFMHMLSAYHSIFFSNSNKTFQYLDNQTHSESSTSGSTKIVEGEGLDAISFEGFLNKVFILNNNPTKARKLFEVLQQNDISYSHKILVENVTGGRGKNLALSKSHASRVLVGGYDFLMQCIGEKIVIDQVLIIENLGLLHEPIRDDISYRLQRRM